MDLLDLIIEKQFVGQEFLTWLWWKSEERGGAVKVDLINSDITVAFEKHMLLEAGEGESNEKVTCSGLLHELMEARAGLKMGKKLQQARMHICVVDREYLLTLTSKMEFKNVKLPKTAETENNNDKLELEGAIYERVSLFTEISDLVEHLIAQYLTVRVSEEWSAELSKIRSWVNAAHIA